MSEPIAMTATTIIASVAPDPPSGEMPNMRSIKSIARLPLRVRYGDRIARYSRSAASAPVTHILTGTPSGKLDPTVRAAQSLLLGLLPFLWVFKKTLILCGNSAAKGKYPDEKGKNIAWSNGALHVRAARGYANKKGYAPIVLDVPG
jgi:hypothetical protein